MSARFAQDKALVAAIASGDEGAFQQVFSALSRDVFKTCYAVLLDHQAAEDATQDSFVKLWHNAGSWSADASLKTWLLTIARNRCLDVLRKKKNDLKKHEELYKDMLVNNQGHSRIDENALDEAAYEADIQKALFSLPERQREAVSLVYYAELHNYEAAQVMGIKVGAFDSLLARARRSMGEKLKTREHQLRGYFFDGQDQ